MQILPLPDTSHGLTALAGAAGYAVLLKLTDWLLHRGKEVEDDATRMRRELREEVVGLRKEVTALQKDVGDWREKYYSLLQAHSSKTVEYEQLKAKVTDLEKQSQERGDQVVKLKQELKYVRGFIRELKDVPEDDEPAD